MTTFLGGLFIFWALGFIISKSMGAEKDIKVSTDEYSIQYAKEKEKSLDEINRNNRERRERIQQKEDEERAHITKLKHIDSISTSNPIKWGKYTLIINRAETKFIDIYNFQTPQEFKQQNLITPLAYTLLFEETRLSRLSPDGFIELLVGFGGNRDFHKLIKPLENIYVDFEMFKEMYTLYIDFRAKGIRPIVSMMVTLDSLERTVSKEEIDSLSDEYNHKLMFGTSV
jgi:hypothetical protein